MADKSFFSLVLAGAAGQGIQTVESIVTRLMKNQGYYVFSTKEYMSRVRGGVNSTEILISSGAPCRSFRTRTDVAILFTGQARQHLEKRISSSTMIFADESLADELGEDVIPVSFKTIAREAGSRLYENAAAVGMIAALFSLPRDAAGELLHSMFGKKGEKVAAGNRSAAEAGWDALPDDCTPFRPGAGRDLSGEMLLSGKETVAFGAAAGGCSFICSYPMSPGTGVLTTLAKYSHELNIGVEQVEDEITAVNMALGAWYAGARTLVTTSGGGFALMCEGLSLAGIMELPLVIHLAQRPGPATGLPTRTEQGDLSFALHGGHGEFPRIIYAPGDAAQGFECARRAMIDADRFQVPALILTDQYLMDSVETVGNVSVPDAPKGTEWISKTKNDYKRYDLSAGPVSPRGVPEYGEGIVCCDSDEHTEEGYITEDHDVRRAMVEKRAAKEDRIRTELPAPFREGSPDPALLVVAWGSNFHVVREAIEETGRDDIAFLHFSCVWPLHEGCAEIMDRADKTVLVETNSTGQFGRIIRAETGRTFDHRLLSYTGLPFDVESLTRELNRIYTA
ncbi:MAG: 2-oxoacid:acceptor oxidoreductase subunit alpha [Fibrobacterota bacterium]